MLDSLATARRLSEAGMDRAQAEALADVFGDFGQNMVTPQMLSSEIATLRTELRTEVATLRAEMYRALLLQTIAILGAMFAMLQLMR